MNIQTRQFADFAHKVLHKHKIETEARYYGGTSGFKIPGLGIAAIFAALAISCDPVPEIRSLDWGDLSPPSLLSQSIGTDGTISLEFDEDVTVVADSLNLDQGLAVVSEPSYPESGNQKLISLSIGGNAIPGAPYTFELSVADSSGNDIFIVLPFYGPNPHPAKVLINEVLTKSSTNNRDAIELLVTEGGNIGGITVALGTTNNFDSRIILPSREVETGDFIIVHCKPDGGTDEINEVQSKSASGGKNSSPNAWDFWIRDSTGLPDTTGIVVVAATAMGPTMDAFFYTDKTSEEGKDYRSFGTRKMMERADELAAAGAWKKSGTVIKPEDGARSTGATATRSLNRAVNHSDTNSATDWHVVPSGALSLGAENVGDIYVAASRR